MNKSFCAGNAEKFRKRKETRVSKRIWTVNRHIDTHKRFASFAKHHAKEYLSFVMANIVLAAILGLAFGTLQLLLMRRVLHVKAGWQRAALFALKLPLWALAFIGVALWWSTSALLAFGLTAGTLYLAVTLYVFFRARQKGE